MNDIALALIIGICSSLLATALFVSIAELFRRVVLPWYADKIYRGVRINGNWEAEFMGHPVVDLTEGEITQSLILVQKGDSISGTYTHTSPEEMDVYDINGCVRDQYFMATATPQSNRQIDGVVLMMRIFNKGGRQRLKGGILYRSDEGDSNVGVHKGVTFSWVERHRGSARSKRKKKGEQGGAGEPATRSESDSEGGDKPQPESEGRSR
jgi:hypothetical protein